eukprot:1668729-Rhodomonas_salina.1
MVLHAVRCEVLTERMVLQAAKRRARYKGSGREPVWSYALATRCPILTAFCSQVQAWRVLQVPESDICYAKSGTDVAYAATELRQRDRRGQGRISSSAVFRTTDPLALYYTPVENCTTDSLSADVAWRLPPSLSPSLPPSLPPSFLPSLSTQVILCSEKQLLDTMKDACTKSDPLLSNRCTPVSFQTHTCFPSDAHPFPFIPLRHTPPSKRCTP